MRQIICKEKKNQNQEEGLSAANHPRVHAATCADGRKTTYCDRKSVSLLSSVAMLISLSIQDRIVGVGNYLEHIAQSKAEA